MNKLIASSANPETLSLTVKGFLMMSIPLIVFLAEKQGMALREEDLITIISNITYLIAEATIIIGLIRKLYYFIKNL